MPRGLPAVWRIGMAVSMAVCLVLLAHLLSSLLGVSVPLACCFSRAFLSDCADPHLITSAEGSQEHRHFSCSDFSGFLVSLSFCLKGALQLFAEKPVVPIISFLGV